MRIRQYIESNYKSVFFNGKTIRMKIDNSSPILSIPNWDMQEELMCIGERYHLG